MQQTSIVSVNVIINYILWLLTVLDVVGKAYLVFNIPVKCKMGSLTGNPVVLITRMQICYNVKRNMALMNN